MGDKSCNNHIELKKKTQELLSIKGSINKVKEGEIIERKIFATDWTDTKLESRIYE